MLEFICGLFFEYIVICWLVLILWVIYICVAVINYIMMWWKIIRNKFQG